MLIKQKQKNLQQKGINKQKQHIFCPWACAPCIHCEKYSSLWKVLFTVKSILHCEKYSSLWEVSFTVKSVNSLWKIFFLLLQAQVNGRQDKNSYTRKRKNNFSKSGD